MNVNNGKVYVGKVEDKTTDFGTFQKIGVTADDLRKLADLCANDRGWVNLDMKPTRDGGHYLQVNMYGIDTDLSLLESEPTEASNNDGNSPF